MKYLGLLCMAAAAVAGGFLLAGEWEMRVKMLGIFRQMAVYLKARILYSNETLPEFPSDRQPVFRREFRDGGGGRTLFPTGGKADGGRSWEGVC